MSGKSMVLLSAVTLVLMVTSLPRCDGHGRLLYPPSRASMWRAGFDNPANTQDNELFCGGFWHQWGINGGKCGVCGDPWDGVREHEAGGKYANGLIAANYTQAQEIEVEVQISAHHQGWFEFRLCENNDVNTPIQQSCLDRHLLPLATTGETRHNITADIRQYYYYKLQLPLGVHCSQCVLQWKYNTGNSWGTDDQGNSGIGYGPQEQFYACSDVTIFEDTGISIPITTTTTPGPTTTTTTAPTTPTPEPCVPSETYKDVIGMVKWCEDNCGDHQAWQSPDCPVVCVCP